MPQGPIATNIATNPAGAYAPLKIDASGNLQVAVESSATDPSTFSIAEALTTAQALKLTSGEIVAINNLVTTQVAYLTTTAQQALGTTGMASIYDVSLPALGALTTTQIGALTTSSLVAIVPPWVPSLKLETPVKHGLVVVPGIGQVVAAVYK